MNTPALPAVFYRMLRSFIELADTLNLSEAAKQLNTTRHTIKRHIADLEKLKGQKFFLYENRRFKLTLEGINALDEAKYLTAQANQWLDNKPGAQDQFRDKVFKDQDEYLYVQEYQIADVWKHGVPLLQSGLHSWVKSKGQIESPEFKKIRPYLVLFRAQQDSWLCVEVGEQSSFMSWVGWAVAKSSIGTCLDFDPIVSRSGRQMTDAYKYAAKSGGIVYEHVCATLPRGQQESLHPANFQRLIFSCFYPDGSVALATLVARTNSILIKGIDSKEAPKMPESDLMEFDI